MRHLLAAGGSIFHFVLAGALGENARRLERSIRQNLPLDGHPYVHPRNIAKRIWDDALREPYGDRDPVLLDREAVLTQLLALAERTVHEHPLGSDGSTCE